MTDVYAVVGNPVAHSKSPRIHADFARRTGQDLVYEAILAPLGGFAATVDAFRARGGCGMNVTVPFKLEAYGYAGEHTPRAERAGAVNTLRFDEGRVLGDNTDGVGLAPDIESNLGITLKGRQVLLLGAGGAAGGVVLPVLERGPAGLLIANRTPERAVELRALFPEFANLEGGGYEALAGRRFDVVINATQLPEAVTLLKQGVGRLIRDERDRGVLMILDERLLAKPYGRTVLASLPPFSRTREEAVARAFFSA